MVSWIKAAQFPHSGRPMCGNLESCGGKNVCAHLDPFHLNWSEPVFFGWPERTNGKRLRIKLSDFQKEKKKVPSLTGFWKTSYDKLGYFLSGLTVHVIYYNHKNYNFLKSDCIPANDPNFIRTALILHFKTSKSRDIPIFSILTSKIVFLFLYNIF